MHGAVVEILHGILTLKQTTNKQTNKNGENSTWRTLARVIDMISLLVFQFSACLHSNERKPLPTVKTLKARPLYGYVNSEDEPHYNIRAKEHICS